MQRKCLSPKTKTRRWFHMSRTPPQPPLVLNTLSQWSESKVLYWGDGAWLFRALYVKERVWNLKSFLSDLTGNEWRENARKKYISVTLRHIEGHMLVKNDSKIFHSVIISGQANAIYRADYNSLSFVQI